MYQNMVNSDFSIALNQTNSSVEFANSILSRDSIYVVCFDLTKEYSHSLEESAVFQNGNITDLLQQYVEPYTHLINGLDAMIQDSKSTHCLIASDIREDNDFSKSFSLLLLNTEKNKLYWFYFTTWFRYYFSCFGGASSEVPPFSPLMSMTVWAVSPVVLSIQPIEWIIKSMVSVLPTVHLILTWKLDEVLLNTLKTR